MLYSKNSLLPSGRWLRVVDPLPLCPSALQATCPVNSSELAPLSQLGSPSQQSPQGQVLTDILKRCRNFFPAVGRNQTLLKLVVLPSAEFSSGISQQRNLLPNLMSLSNMDWVPSPRSQQQISHNEQLSGRARESSICNSNPFVQSNQVVTYDGLIQGEAFNIFHRNQSQIFCDYVGGAGTLIVVQARKTMCVPTIDCATRPSPSALE